jgi:purine-binding chemotaxis protein CheW
METASGGVSQSSVAAQAKLKAKDAGVCLFRIGGKRFAVETGIVGEVIGIPSILRVPKTPPAVLGLFSLRGTPVAVVDLLRVLGHGSVELSGKEFQILVLRTEQGVLAGILVDSLDAVVPRGRGVRTYSEAMTEHDAIVGFFSTDAGASTSILLGTKSLVDALASVGFQENPTRA